MSTKTINSSHNRGKLTLANRVVMAPMTRSRAINNLPNELIAAYYSQRSSAGLIITEGVSPSPNGLGYARIPGIFSDDQVKAWQQTTRGVHDNGGKIFMQIMHTGRVTHPLNLPAGGRVVAPSAVALSGEAWTDQAGMSPFPLAEALSTEDLVSLKAEYIQAAKNAIAAGFDGIELHNANGYLLEQFLSPHTNRRTDNYGGSIENRARFVLEVITELVPLIGADKIGIRISPFSVFNDMPHYAAIESTYTYLATELNALDIAYIHLADNTQESAEFIAVRDNVRAIFTNTIILAGGYTADRAERDLSSGVADLIAFGRPFIVNPDLVERLQKSLPVNITLDANTLYSAGAKGFTDYPIFEHEIISA